MKVINVKTIIIPIALVYKRMASSLFLNGNKQIRETQKKTKKIPSFVFLVPGSLVIFVGVALILLTRSKRLNLI
jgi:hypothetical protein